MTAENKLANEVAENVKIIGELNLANSTVANLEESLARVTAAEIKAQLRLQELQALSSKITKESDKKIAYWRGEFEAVTGSKQVNVPFRHVNTCFLENHFAYSRSLMSAANHYKPNFRSGRTGSRT